MINHGRWSRYTPETLPDGAPPNTMFARRDSDGVDWYDYVRGDKFKADTIKLTVYWSEPFGGHVVGAAVYEADRLFPQEAIVIELDDYTGRDPQADLGNMMFDLKTGRISEKPPLPPSGPIYELQKLVEALTERVAKLEAR